jgi:hypothetical protein
VLGADRPPTTRVSSWRLVLVSEYSATPSQDGLQEAQRRTAVAYRQAGIEVTEISQKEIDNWCERQSPRLDSAIPDFQYLYFAEALDFDVIGGVTPWATDHDPPLFTAWVLNLRRMTRNFVRVGTKAGPVELLDYFDAMVKPLRAIKRLHPLTPQAQPFTFRHDLRKQPQIPLEPLFSQDVPFLGISYNCIDDDQSGSSIVVTQVYPSSPAAKGGIGPGDIITQIEGNVPYVKGGAQSINGTNSPWQKSVLPPLTGSKMRFFRLSPRAAKAESISEIDDRSTWCGIREANDCQQQGKVLR